MSLPTVAKVGIGWTVVAVIGLYSFVLSKRKVHAKRYESMKARERLRNTGTAV